MSAVAILSTILPLKVHISVISLGQTLRVHFWIYSDSSQATEVL